MKIKIDDAILWLEWDSEDEDENLYEVVNWFEKSSYQFFSTEHLLEEFGYKNYQEIVDSGFFISVLKTDIVALMKKFVASHNDGEEIAKEIDNIIKNDNYGYDSGYAVAFRIFMEVNDDIWDEYEKYKKESLTKDAVKWCEENGISYYFENSEYKKVNINELSYCGVYHSDNEAVNENLLFDVEKYEYFSFDDACEELGIDKVNEYLSSGRFIELFRTDMTSLQKDFAYAYKNGKYVKKIEKLISKEDYFYSAAFYAVSSSDDFDEEWDRYMDEKLVSDAIEWCNKNDIGFFVPKNQPEHLGSKFKNK